MSDIQSYPSFLLENAVNQFAKLPGIGRKTALQLALHMLKQEKNDVDDFAQSILLLKTKSNIAKICKNISDNDVCQICSDLNT